MVLLQKILGVIQLSDAKLIDIFVQNYDKLSITAIMILKDKDAAWDVMQSVAVVLLKKEYSIEEIQKPMAYLATCVRRATLNYLRDESRSYSTDPTLLESINHDMDSYKAIDYLEWTDSLNSYLENYSSELKDAFIRHYVDGYPLAQIAGELGMTPNALSQQFKRMRNHIKAQSPSLLALLLTLSMF